MSGSLVVLGTTRGESFSCPGIKERRVVYLYTGFSLGRLASTWASRTCVVYDTIPCLKKAVKLLGTEALMWPTASDTQTIPIGLLVVGGHCFMGPNLLQQPTHARLDYRSKFGKYAAAAATTTTTTTTPAAATLYNSSDTKRMASAATISPTLWKGANPVARNYTLLSRSPRPPNITTLFMSLVFSSHHNCPPCPFGAIMQQHPRPVQGFAYSTTLLAWRATNPQRRVRLRGHAHVELMPPYTLNSVVSHPWQPKCMWHYGVLSC